MKIPPSDQEGNARAPTRRLGLAGGTMLVFAGEALALPAGILLTALLTRRLGVEDYGRFTLLVTLIAWVEWSLSSVWSRATIKLVSEADDWRPVGRAAARLSLGGGLVSGVLLAVFAWPLAHFFGEPTIALPLLLLAADIPLFSLAQAHRSLLVGRGEFTGRATVTAGRSLFRLLFIALMVLCGFGVTGAVLGSIGASVAELAVARFFIRPSVLGGDGAGTTTVPARRLWEAAGPLLIYAVCLRLFDKLDLFVLKALGGTARDAGLYGAAQNLAMLPGVFSMAFIPALLAAVGQARRRERESGNEDEARALGCNALRAAMILLPFGALVAACAPELVRLFFGLDFAGAAPFLGILFFASLAQCVFSVATALLTAGDRIWWTAVLAGGLLPLALAGHLLVIPHFGPTGAATVTLVLSIVAAVAALAAVHHRWSILPPPGTIARTAVATAAIYTLGSLLPSRPETLPLPFLLLGKALLLALVGALAYVLLGEGSPGERARFRSALRRRPGGVLP